MCNILARCVHTSNLNSPFLKWHQGTRQGCPLSSFLLTIVIEPLALFFSNQELLQGMKFGNPINIVSLYADDIPIFSCNPNNNLPLILQLIGFTSPQASLQILWENQFSWNDHTVAEPTWPIWMIRWDGILDTYR